MPTGAELKEDKEWLRAQGLDLRAIHRLGHKATYYRPDGKAIPNLPTGFYHRQVYRRKGWTLVPQPMKMPVEVEPRIVAPVGTVMPHTLSHFVAGCLHDDSRASVTNPEMWQAYQAWCEEKGEKHPLGRKRFSQELRNLGFLMWRSQRARSWRGIRLKTEIVDEPQG